MQFFSFDPLKFNNNLCGFLSFFSHMVRVLFFFVLFAIHPFDESICLANENTFTLWPLVDSRSSSAINYQSFHLIGPLLKYETKDNETEYAFRPFFYHAKDNQGTSMTEFLYPIFRKQKDKETSTWHFLRLINVDSGPDEMKGFEKSYLFPFIFSGDHRERGEYFAIFPLGGTLYGWFGRDEIEFYLFPLYGRTQRNGTRIDNVLWPFFAEISGESETGFKFWPLYGKSRKDGHYQKSFFLWPIFFSEDLDLNTPNPVSKRAVFPLYYSKESSNLSHRVILWPFFSWKDDREKGYKERWTPWPLVRRMSGNDHNGVRNLPFYADETRGDLRNRWYLWPIYKIEEMHTELIDRRRDRILFFLYSDLIEHKIELDRTKRQIALWPFFGYQRIDEVSHLYLLALLESFFPDNEGIERSWAPLWRLYQKKWDQHGNSATSLLWNLYWSEKRGSNLAWELFPLFEYRRVKDEGKSFCFLKGLFQIHSDQTGRTLKLLFLSWQLPMKTASHHD
ncbi:MAG: hypothetical protein JRE63_04210 [Deltaproteobacteria bacterium]|nr:hypothetical protein [Deltaproteobacteria bacterium]